MKITLKKLTLRNFKGIKNFEFVFDKNTSISGDNGTGKTTVFDAFTWLLFGKDSQDRQNFEVKTLNPDGSPIHKLEHEVEGLIDVNGQEMKLRRVLKEKWVTRRGSSDADFTGHETTFYINDVPMQAGEYQTKISEIIPESNFKLVTNPSYFNQQMKWQERRELLTSIAPNVTEIQIAGSDQELIDLVEMMRVQKKTDEDFKKEYSAKKKLIKKDLESIPGRIDEVSRMNSGDGEEINPTELNESLLKIDTELTSVRESYEQQKKSIQDRRRKASMIESAISDRTSILTKANGDKKSQTTEKIADLMRQFQSVNNKKDFLEKEIKEFAENIKVIEVKIEKLREDWYAVNNDKFVLTTELKCPTCLQDLPNVEERKIELSQNFNKEKISRMKSITDLGTGNAERIKSLKKSIDEKSKEVEILKVSILSINKEIGLLESNKEDVTPIADILNSDPELKKLEAELKEVEKTIVSVPDDKASIELEQKRGEIIAALERFKSIEASKLLKVKRLNELTDQEKSLSLQLADLEKFEFVIDRYQTNRINMIEKSVNSMFKLVTFRMFDQQINGGEKPTCETLINGVPYSDANHAGKINAGIDIINTFSDHLKLTAPIWVDNAEAVNVLTETKSQLIKLIVTKDKSLILNS